MDERLLGCRACSMARSGAQGVISQMRCNVGHLDSTLTSTLLIMGSSSPGRSDEVSVGAAYRQVIISAILVFARGPACLGLQLLVRFLRRLNPVHLSPWFDCGPGSGYQCLSGLSSQRRNQHAEGRLEFGIICAIDDSELSLVNTYCCRRRL